VGEWIEKVRIKFTGYAIKQVRTVLRFAYGLSVTVISIKLFMSSFLKDFKFIVQKNEKMPAIALRS